MAKRRSTTLRIGPVSHGTMRPEDLIPSFLWECNHIRLSQTERDTVRGIAREFNTFPDDFGIDAVNAAWREQMNDALMSLFDILDAHCPDFCTFGAHEGDGSDYGVWPNTDIDAHDGVFRSPCLPGENETETHAAREFPHWLHVNDHGNATLYRRAGNRWIEVWGVV